jgi:uncharacterized membrane protein
MINDFRPFQIHGHGDNQGIADLVDTFLMFLESLTEKSGSEIFASLLPGLYDLINIHPLFVHFPIAFLTVFIIVDTMGSFLNKTDWRTFAGGLLYVGTATAFLTVITGLIAAHSVPHNEITHRLMENHETLGITILSLATLLAIWRWKAPITLKNEFNIVYLLLSGILGICLLFGADLGGTMVYRYGISVKAIPFSNTEQHSHKDS